MNSITDFMQQLSIMCTYGTRGWGDWMSWQWGQSSTEVAFESSHTYKMYTSFFKVQIQMKTLKNQMRLHNAFGTIVLLG